MSGSVRIYLLKGCRPDFSNDRLLILQSGKDEEYGNGAENPSIVTARMICRLCMKWSTSIGKTYLETKRRPRFIVSSRTWEETDTVPASDRPVSHKQVDREKEEQEKLLQ